MKKIKIFLASSIGDLKEDRIELGDFIRQLNDIYLDRGVYFSLVKCEDYDNSIAAGGKQSVYDREIVDSELCVFLFFRKVGDYTRHEFDIALDAFRTAQKPKIVTYFKYVNSPDEAEGEVKAFMQMLDVEVKHYYNIYQNIDTLRLGLLMQIKLMGLDAEEPEVEDGKVVFGGKVVADTARLPAFTGSASLGELKEKYGAISARYYELREKLSSDVEDEETELEYRKVASERSQTEEKIREAEKAVLETLRSMYAETAHGGLSPRSIAGYRALERGDYAGALEILDTAKIMSDIAHYEEMKEGYREFIQTGVDELLQRIGVLKSCNLDEDVIAEIEQLYAAVETCVEKNGLDKTPLLSYAYFLATHNDRDKALEVATQLGYYYFDPKHPADDWKKADLWTLIGTIYVQKFRYGEAEGAFTKAEELYQKLAEKNFPAFASALANVYFSHGALYLTTMKKFESARSIIKSGLRCLEKLAAETPAAVEAGLAMGYGNLAATDVFLELNAEAEEAFKKAIGLYERFLSRDMPEQIRTPFEVSLAKTYSDYAIFLTDLERMNEADDMFDKAIELYEGPVDRDPAAYEPALAACYGGVGHLNAMCEDCEEEAEEAYLYVLATYERLAKTDPEAYEPLTARTCLALYDLYDEMEDERAPYYLKRAYELALKYPQNEFCIPILEEFGGSSDPDGE